LTMGDIVTEQEKLDLAPTGTDKATDSVDRIVLRRLENDKLQGWVAALNARFDGMIRVTKSDLANILVRQHADELSEAEVKTIEAEMFDEVRWLNWAVAKLRQAKKDGVPLTLNDLVAKRDLIGKQRGPSTKSARPRRKKAPAADASEYSPEVPDYSELEEG
jgi:hypothetical protein